VIRRDEVELVAYLAEHADRARLVLRETPDGDAALRALRRAAAAVGRIPHPVEPAQPLPNWCDAFFVDGVPVLHLDIQDHAEYAERIAAAVLTALDADGIDGRLEPLTPPAPPFDYDGNADIIGPADYLAEVDERGLPPAFPVGFPVPRAGTLVLAQRAREDTWVHAAWRRGPADPPFEEYLRQLRTSGCVLEEHPEKASADDGGMHGYTFERADGVGAVWLYHEELRYARRRGRGGPARWYASVIWAPAQGGRGASPRLPARFDRPPPTRGQEPAPSNPIELAYGQDQLVYESNARALLGPLLEPGALVGYEASVGFSYLKPVLDRFTAELPKRLLGDERLNPLLPLRRRGAGMPVEELVAKLTDVFGSEDPLPMLDERERAGELVRSASPAGDGSIIVGLTEQGHRAMDEYLRRIAGHQSVLVEGISPEQLAVVRHACLLVIANRQAPDRRETALDETGLLYDMEQRESFGTLEPAHVRCLETVDALRAASFGVSLPQRLRVNGQVRMLLRLHQQPDGLALDRVIAGLDGDGSAQWLDAGGRAGALTRSPHPAGDGAEIVRLTETGHQTAGAYLGRLGSAITATYTGIHADHLAQLRDACWRIVLNYQRTAAG
jgi:hypothetical protein